MSAQHRYTKIGVSVCAWSGVLLTATFGAHTPVTPGLSSWGYTTLLGLLVCTAVMAEPLSNRTLSFWMTKAIQREREAGRAMLAINAIARRSAQTFSEGRSYFVSLFLSCKRVTRRLVSSGSHG